MRWINGLTKDARWQNKVNRKGAWHRWFAWYPVTVCLTERGLNERKVKAWLETLERKSKIVSYGYDDTFWEHEYRFLEDK